MFWEPTEDEKEQVLKLWESRVAFPMIAVKMKLSQERVRKIVNDHAREQSRVGKIPSPTAQETNGNEYRALYRGFHR
jgi:iron-sulfur cluster repair protein YtfE (RIC family)